VATREATKTGTGFSLPLLLLRSGHSPPGSPLRRPVHGLFEEIRIIELFIAQCRRTKHSIRLPLYSLPDLFYFIKLIIYQIT
jgi:hypothetical protein